MNKLSIALMGKIDQVYGNLYKDCWLSMNTLPQIFDREDLDFKHEVDKDAFQIYDNQFHFSELVDEIPEYNSFYQLSGKKLTDAYQQIIFNIISKEYKLSEEDQKILDKAESTLESSKYEAYTHCREKVNEKKIEKNSITASIINSDDEDFKKAQKEKYDEIDEEIKSLQLEWIQDGFKFEIEKAIQQKQSIKQKGFLNDSQDLLLDFDANILTNSMNEEFRPCTLTHNIGKGDTGWSKITLNKNEIEKLCKNASEKFNIKPTNEDSDNEIAIEKLEAKFCLVKIHRSWFNEDLFENKFWKLPTFMDEVSDGNVPPKGMLPGYSFALIFVKDVDIELEATKKNENIIEKSQEKPIIKVGPIVMDTALVTKETISNRIKISNSNSFRPEVLKANNIALSKLAKKKFESLSSARKATKPKGIFSRAALRMPIIGAQKIHGKVLLENGKALGNTQISFVNKSNETQVKTTQTNAEGLYEITLDSNNYLMKISVKGYFPYQLDLNQLQKSELNIQMQPIKFKFQTARTFNLMQIFCQLSGVVENEEGKPQANINIEIYNTDNKVSSSVKTDDKGAFNSNIVKGNYKIRINEDGYEPLEMSKKFDKNENIKISLKNSKDLEKSIEDDFEGLQLFGYLCKIVPKSPNCIVSDSSNSDPDVTDFQTENLPNEEGQSEEVQSSESQNKNSLSSDSDSNDIENTDSEKTRTQVSNYYIIQSFSKSENANKYLNSLEDKGSFTIIESKNLFRIGIEKSKVEDLESLKSKYPDMWLLKSV